MERQISLKIYGDVQGVFYRAQTEQKATALKLGGWVKNGQDGTVTVVAEGDELRLKELIDWCYNIPNARVEKIDVRWEKAGSKFKKFKIEH